MHMTQDMSLEGQPVEGVVGKTWQLPCYSDEVDEHGNVTKKIKTRGLYDSFMQEYAEFLLKRKTFKVRVQATVAQLNDITNHWRDRYRINGMLGWIGKMTYNISKSEGVKDVELEFHTM